MTKPIIAEGVFIAPGAKVSGSVTIGADCGVFFNAVLRGDVGSISIGRRCNIQDNCVLHPSQADDIHIGDNVTVGHGAIVHGCTIGSNVLIGMGSIIMNGAEIGEHCVIGAGAIVTEGKKIPPRSLLIGSPARIVRQLSEEEAARIELSALHYDKLRRKYLEGEYDLIEG